MIKATPGTGSRPWSPTQSIRSPPGQSTGAVLAVGDDVEALLLQLINADRAAEGLAPLVIDRELDAAADAHAADMLANDYFEHDSQDDRSPGDRIEAAGYNARGWGENIAWVSDSNGVVDPAEVERLHDNLMNSPGDRANLLDEDFTEIGLGLKAEGGKVMLTEDFGTPTAAEAVEGDKGSAPTPSSAEEPPPPAEEPPPVEEPPPTAEPPPSSGGETIHFAAG